MWHSFSKFTSGSPEIRIPWLNTATREEQQKKSRDASRASTSRSNSRNLSFTEDVKRRFPKFTRVASDVGMVPRVTKKWNHPLLLLLENPIFEKRALSKIGETIKPILWAPLSVAGAQMPRELAEALSPKRGYRARLLRSPERRGLKDAMRQSAKTREFTIGKAMNLAYGKDIRFLLLVCSLIGITVWWAKIPELLFNQPELICSPQHATLLREALSDQVCPMRNLGFQCIHPESVHDKVVEIFKEPEFFDPLKLAPESRTIAFATLVGVIILVLTLGESVTPNGLVC